MLSLSRIMKIYEKYEYLNMKYEFKKNYLGDLI